MKKVLIGTTVFFSFTTIALAYILLFTGTELIKGENDTRTTVKYAPDLRNLVMSEMRDYLEIMAEIQQGLAEDNPEKIYKAALKEGQLAIDATPTRLLKLSPIPCKTMGFNGHHIFQAIADSAKINYNKETTIQQMAKLTNNCNACHRTYKIELE